MVTPTSPTVAFKLGAKTDDPLAMYMNDYCTVPMPLAGIPAISIPAGVAGPDGGGPELPVGFQIAGPAFSDSAMLDAAYALESAIGFQRTNGDGGGELRSAAPLTDEQFRDAVQGALDSLPLRSPRD